MVASNDLASIRIIVSLAVAMSWSASHILTYKNHISVCHVLEI